MSPGERIVWAAAFDHQLQVTADPVAAARWAAFAVKSLRRLFCELRADLDMDEREMVDDVLGGGR